MAINDESKRPERTVEQTFAANLRALREAQHISQDALAQAMGERGHSWQQSTVYKIEGGTRNIKLGEARAVAEVLHVPLDRLTEDTSRVAELTRLRSNVHSYEKMQHGVEQMARNAEKVRLSLRKRAGLDGHASEVGDMLTDDERNGIDDKTRVSTWDRLGELRTR